MKRNQRAAVMAHKRHTFGIISLLGVMWLSTSAWALPPASTQEIMKQALEYSDFGLSNAKSDVTMILVDSRNRKKVRSVQIFSADKDEGESRLIRMLAPQNVKGVAFLTRHRAESDDDQYLFMPALKKVKRIVGKQKGRPFMGTDFSYIDLEKRVVEDFAYKQLEDETVGDRACYVVEATPLNKDIALYYGKLKYWIAKEVGVPVRIEFYDTKKQQLVKEYVAHKLETRSGRIVVSQAEMLTTKKSHRTLLRIDAIDWQAKLPDHIFNHTTLARF